MEKGLRWTQEEIKTNHQTVIDVLLLLMIQMGGALDGSWMATVPQ